MARAVAFGKVQVNKVQLNNSTALKVANNSPTFVKAASATSFFYLSQRYFRGKGGWGWEWTNKKVRVATAFGMLALSASYAIQAVEEHRKTQANQAAKQVFNKVFGDLTKREPVFSTPEEIFGALDLDALKERFTQP